jgi:TrmH family RNA methyltransferase
MGAFIRVNIQYANLPDFLNEYKEQTGHTCYGTFLEGENIYKTELSKEGLFILGNEGNGISIEVENLVDKKIHIPSFAKGESHAESLNISVAGAVVASEFRRREG